MRYFYQYFNLFIFLFTSVSVIAADLDQQGGNKSSYTVPYNSGFYWYDDNYTEQQNKNDAIQTNVIFENSDFKTIEPENQKLNYDQLWVMHPDNFAKELDRRQKLAIQFPTVDNIYEYLEVQDVAKRKSVAFASVMGYVSQLNPQFSGENNYPVNVPGQNVYRSEKDNEQDEYLNKVRNDFALLVFNSEGCKYCQSQEPILDMFYATHGWIIKRIDINQYSDIATKYSITQTPSIVLLSKTTNKAIPLTSGLITLPELKERLFRSVRMINGEIEPEQWYSNKMSSDPLKFIKK